MLTRTTLALLAAALLSASAAPLHPDVYLNGTELIASRGFRAEEHDVTTSDGYILKLFRIPCSRNGKCGGPPVLVVHALVCSADEFLLDGAEQSLGYVLADAGFDVWLANKRGNTYSKRHTRLSTSSTEFWDYSWDEVGLIDIPEQIDYILAQTGYKTLGYVGHSEGTTAGFVAASQPGVGPKINALGMLAPIANMTELGNLEVLKWLMRKGEIGIYLTLGRKEFLSQTPFLKKYGPEFCHLCPKCCEDILFTFCGFSAGSNNYDSSRFEVYYAHTPSGTSIRNMVHWMQDVDTGRFQMYDWGFAKNLFKYGSFHPPAYDITTIQAPVALYAGGKDILATPKNVETITRMLPHYTLWTDPAYEHMDFAWGLDAHTKFYPHLVQHLRQGAGL